MASTSTPHAVLERADSDGSDSSTLSSNTSNSACSSLFSSGRGGINNDGDEAERRGSFASSVHDEYMKESTDEDDDLLGSSETTPIPSIPLPSPSPSMHIAASSASSDGGSDSNLSMATPTAELYALSLQPVSTSPVPAPSASISDSPSSSPPSSATMPIAAPRSPHKPASTNKAVIDAHNQHKGGRLPFGTSPEMLKFAQRVASRGVSFSHQAPAGSVPSRNSSELSRSTSSRPSTSNGNFMKAEGFPWTARPSSYTPRSSHASSSSRPASSSSSAYAQTSNKLIATPSDIFSAFQDSSPEEESDALPSLFPSTYSASLPASNSTSRPATRESATTTESTALHHHQQNLHARGTAQPSFLKNSQSYASSSSTETVRQRSSTTAPDKQRQIASGGLVNDFGVTRVTTAYPATNSDISAASMPASSGSRNVEKLLSTQLQEQDQSIHGIRNGERRGGKSHTSGLTPVGKLGSSEDQHSLTPDSRSNRGGQESSTTTEISPLSSSRTQSAEASTEVYQSLLSVPPASSPSSFSHHHSQQIEPSDTFNTHDSDTIQKRSHRSSASASSSYLSSASVFRYEAPMAAALVLLPSPHQTLHTGNMTSTTALPTLSNRLGSHHTIPSSESLSSPNASLKIGMSVSKVDASTDAVTRSTSHDQKNTSSTEMYAKTPSHLTPLDVKIPSPTPSSIDSKVGNAARANPITTDSLPSSKHVSLDYGNDLNAGERRSSTSHLNSLNYHAGVGDNTYSSPSSRNSTSAGINILSRPATSNSYSSIYGTSASSRSWVKDSDNSSLRSSSGVSSDGNTSFEGGNETQLEASVMSPAAPPPVPFLSTAPAPPGCKIQVEALQPDGFDVYVTLPGFTYENITLALKRNGALHILADKYDGSAGHFERMVELGEAAMNCKVTAEFNGHRLKVLMRKKAGYSTRTSASSASSISSNTTISSTGSSMMNNYTSVVNGGNNRNSDQLNYDPTLAMMMPSASRNSSSSSSPIVPHASSSPQLYFGGIDTTACSPPPSIMFGSSVMSKTSTHATDGRNSNTSPLIKHASSFDADAPSSRRGSDPSIRARNWADIPE